MAKWVGVAAVALAMGACARATEQVSTDEFVRDRTTLVVENNNWQDVVIYVLRGGTRVRVGSVMSMTTGKFVLSDAVTAGLSDLRIAADPIGSDRRYISDPIPVFDGSQVELRLQNNLALSHYSVW